VEADEVVLVLETEHHARVVVVAVFDINAELVVHFVVHKVLVDEPASARVASTLVPVAAPVGPVARNTFAGITTIARAGLAVLEGALGEIFELGNHGLSRHFWGFQRLDFVYHILELNLRPRDEDAESAHFKIVLAWEREVHVNFAIDPDLNFAVNFSADSEVVVLVLLVLPVRLLGTELFAALADDQVGTNARNAIAVVFPTTDPVLLVPAIVVHVLDGVVEADEVVLVLETEHDARVVVVTVFGIERKLIIVGGIHHLFVDEPVSTSVATGLRPVAALVDPVASFALTSVAAFTTTVLAVIEATLLEIRENGLVRFRLRV